jgi:hypothetical protein
VVCLPNDCPPRGRLHPAWHRIVAVVGAAAALGLVPISTPGVPVLAAGAGAVVVGLFRGSA